MASKKSTHHYQSLCILKVNQIYKDTDPALALQYQCHCRNNWLKKIMTKQKVKGDKRQFVI